MTLVFNDRLIEIETLISCQLLVILAKRSMLSSTNLGNFRVITRQEGSAKDPAALQLKCGRRLDLHQGYPCSDLVMALVAADYCVHVRSGSLSSFTSCHLLARCSIGCLLILHACRVPRSSQYLDPRHSFGDP
jgi:hypothetical protein